MSWRVRVAAALVVFLSLLASHPAAHDIPSDVRVLMFAKPEGQRLRVVIRVPLASIVETAWPERGPGMLDVSRADDLMRDGAISRIADDLEVNEGERRLDAPRVAAVMASQPSDRSFETYEAAVAHVTGPRLPDDTEFAISQGLMDVLFEFAIQSDRSKFSMRPDFERLGVTVQTVLQFLPPDGRPRVFSLHNDPGTVPLDPTRLQASGRFGGEGFFHILQGPDHLLFLFVLVIPFLPARFGAAVRWKALGPLAAIVTSFTVAHSVAFIASAYDLTPGALWFPAFVDAMVAASILYVALENLVRPNFRRRWMVAFGFGLAHGFAFAIALRDSWQFTGDHFLLSLLSFNGGLEIGQLVALIAIVPVLMILFRFVVDEPIGIVILSLLVAHTGWHWTVDRYAAYRRFQFVWPVVDAAFFVIVIRWLMIAVVLAGLAWLIFGVFGQRGHEDTKARNQS